VTAFIATWTGGHPLLIGEVSFPFWMQFGLLVALAGSTLLNAPAVIVAQRVVPARRRVILIAAGAVAIVGATLAVGRPRIPLPTSPSVTGFHDWETAGDGSRYRWSGAFASVFVRGDTARVEIPVKVPAELRMQPALEVDVVVSGVFLGRTRVSGSWVPLEVVLPAPVFPTWFRRIDLRVSRTWQPAIYIAGSADMRTVGIQVGEPRLFR
jgi:hypothetical protein